MKCNTEATKAGAMLGFTRAKSVLHPVGRKRQPLRGANAERPTPFIA